MQHWRRPAPSATRRVWFQDTLARRFRKCQVRAFDTSRTRLSTFLTQRALLGQFPESGVWDIQADITAIITGARNHVAFIECKLGAVTLRDVGQLLGYCRVARPVAAILLSICPPAPTLRTLLVIHGRYDILEYDEDHHRMLLARWDSIRGGILHAETLPPGEHL